MSNNRTLDKIRKSKMINNLRGLSMDTTINRYNRIDNKIKILDNLNVPFEKETNNLVNT